eukprot:SAG31_NODE_436_length_15717_cov_5.420412_12_plen_168_part_00
MMQIRGKVRLRRKRAATFATRPIAPQSRAPHQTFLPLSCALAPQPIKQGRELYAPVRPMGHFAPAVRAVTFSFLCQLFEKCGTVTERYTALIEKVSSFRHLASRQNHTSATALSPTLGTGHARACSRGAQLLDTCLLVLPITSVSRVQRWTQETDIIGRLLRTDPRT